MKNTLFKLFEKKNANLARKHLDFDLEIKEFDEEKGSFSGYASVFNEIDRGGDIIVKGAFLDSLATFEAKKRKIPILWQHNSSEPLGYVKSIGEDDVGLFFDGQLSLDIAKAREAKSLMSNGVISGVSIGYSSKKSNVDQKTGVRTLKELDLFEISLVTFPMNDNARISAVKKRIEDGLMPKTIADFERLLRDVGFSKKNATIIANEGIKNILRSDSGSSEMAVLEALKSFKL